MPFPCEPAIFYGVFGVSLAQVRDGFLSSPCVRLAVFLSIMFRIGVLPLLGFFKKLLRVLFLPRPNRQLQLGFGALEYGGAKKLRAERNRAILALNFDVAVEDVSIFPCLAAFPFFLRCHSL